MQSSSTPGYYKNQIIAPVTVDTGSDNTGKYLIYWATFAHSNMTLTVKKYTSGKLEGRCFGEIIKKDAQKGLRLGYVQSSAAFSALSNYINPPASNL